MKYKNPNYKRARGSFILIVACGFCKTDIAKYQKVGKGGLIRMYIDRIVKSSVDISKGQRAIFCPNCNEQIAARVRLKKKNKEAYKMFRSTFNTRKIN